MDRPRNLSYESFLILLPPPCLNLILEVCYHVLSYALHLIRFGNVSVTRSRTFCHLTDYNSYRFLYYTFSPRTTSRTPNLSIVYLLYSLSTVLGGLVTGLLYFIRGKITTLVRVVHPLRSPVESDYGNRNLNRPLEKNKTKGREVR